MTSLPAHSALPIEAVRNRKTAKLFILVDDSLGTHFRVINPAGELLTLPDLLFEDESMTMTKEEAEAEFTPEQLSALAAYQTVEAERQRAAALLARSRPPEPPTPTREAPKRRPTARASAPRSGAPRPPRGVVITWTSPRLSFYRHKIDPLGDNQAFRIVVDGVGPFEISKEDFLTAFNDVVMSPGYRKDGFFSYPEIPEKARRYLKS